MGECLPSIHLLLTKIQTSIQKKKAWLFPLELKTMGARGCSTRGELASYLESTDVLCLLVKN